MAALSTLKLKLELDAADFERQLVDLANIAARMTPVESKPETSLVGLAVVAAVAAGGSRPVSRRGFLGLGMFRRY